MSALDLIEDLWTQTGQPSEIINNLDLIGKDPVLPSAFPVDKFAQSVIGLTSLTAAEIWRQKTGDSQRVSVDIKQAAAEFRSERYQLLDGQPTANPWDPIAGAYQCGDGRWVRLHTNFEHHRNGILEILKCENNRETVGQAISSWRAEELETTVAEAGFLAVMMRSQEEWGTHPQGRAIAAAPLLTIEKIGEAAPTPLPAQTERPLSGIRVLDLTRIIAGPVAGRTLAAHGANVLRITSPNLPSIPSLVIDNGRGKRSAFLDLKTTKDKASLQTLTKDADVFIQGYRPSAIAGLGFSPEKVAALRPGIVYGSLSAYGTTGPWAERRGFDLLVQTVSGINHSEAQAKGSSQPIALPNQTLDHATGYLLAFGVMAALLRRSIEGGSWHVQVSLAQTGHWLQRQDRIPKGFSIKDQTPANIEAYLETQPSGFGDLTTIRHSGILSRSPAYWSLPSKPLGSHSPTW
jgi:crotonobetainyl-CoA:carnitine CoA-transferase CaiB-like acyl-CoA transferase